MSEDAPKSSRFCFPVTELLFCTAFLSFLAAVEIPIINTAREVQSLPPVLPWLTWILNTDERVFGLDPRTSMIAAPTLTTVLMATVVYLSSKVLPERVRKYFPPTNPKRRQQPTSSP
jgi:hypothetical protein